MSSEKNKQYTLSSGFGGSYEFGLEPLSLDALVNKTPSATYYFRVEGDNEGAKICHGDIVVVDRSLDPIQNSIIVAIVDSELVIRRYTLKGDSVELYREGEKPAETMPKEDFEIWGVVTHSLKDHTV